MPTRPFKVIEVAPQEVAFNPEQKDRMEEHMVLPHLRHYLSLSEQLPAIAVEVRQGRFWATSRVVYLRVARELGRNNIRAVVSRSMAEQETLWSVPGYIRTVAESEISNEQPTGWHLIYFKRPLSLEQQREVVKRLRLFLETESQERNVKIMFDKEGMFLEGRFETPQSEDWQRRYLGFLKAISQEVAAIDTVSGFKFGGE